MSGMKMLYVCPIDFNLLKQTLEQRAVQLWCSKLPVCDARKFEKHCPRDKHCNNCLFYLYISSNSPDKVAHKVSSFGKCLCLSACYNHQLKQIFYVINRFGKQCPALQINLIIKIFGFGGDTNRHKSNNQNIFLFLMARIE